MITGEHAVVYGHPAIVCAIDQRVTLSFEPRHDTKVCVQSDVAETTEIEIADACAEGPLRFVFGAIEQFAAKLSNGFNLTIQSEINPTLGLGSSAAVTAAMFAGLNMMVHPDQDVTTGLVRADLHETALKLIRQIQGRGSGADLAASFFGGMLSYQIGDAESQANVSSLPSPPPMSLRYSGYKTPTSVVLEKVANEMKGREAEFAKLYQKMGLYSGVAIEAAKHKDWPVFHVQIDIYQSLMAKLGVSDEKLDALVEEAVQHPRVESAKISGSGLGDCIVAFGDCPATHTPVKLAEDGIRIEAIG